MATLHISAATTPGSEQDGSLNGPHLHALLRAAGLRPTIHRLYVLRVLDMVAPAAVTAEQVFQHLARMDLTASQATVYRALNELAQHDLVVRMRLPDASDNKVRFAVHAALLPASACTFVCRTCARHVVIADPAFNDQLQRQARASGFDLQLQTMQIAMTCNHCA